jgi:hypothetical protein
MWEIADEAVFLLPAVGQVMEFEKEGKPCHTLQVRLEVMRQLLSYPSRGVHRP